MAPSTKPTRQSGTFRQTSLGTCRTFLRNREREREKKKRERATERVRDNEGGGVGEIEREREEEGGREGDRARESVSLFLFTLSLSLSLSPSLGVHNHQDFQKVLRYKWKVLQYKWEAYCVTNGRSTDSISLSLERRGTESTAIEIGGVLQYRLGVCFNTFLSSSGGLGF